MPENHSQVGKDVERVRISDEPHDKYQWAEPYTGKKLDNPIPILISTKGGAIVRKEVSYHTVSCPECEVIAKYTHDSEPVCPNCGIVCAGKDTILSEQLVRDAKAAGRIEDGASKS